MGPSIFREKTAMMAGRAAKGPRSKERTKELTNQQVSASLPVARLTTGVAPFFLLQNVFFMADLLYRMSSAAQNHFIHRFALIYTQGPCQGRLKGRKRKERECFFPHKNKHMLVI
jgi:hypothetical protein